MDIDKQTLLLETKKQVMAYKLKIRDQLKAQNKEKLLEGRANRRATRAKQNQNQDELQFNDDDEYNLSENDRYGEGE